MECRGGVSPPVRVRANYGGASKIAAPYNPVCAKLYISVGAPIGRPFLRRICASFSRRDPSATLRMTDGGGKKWLSHQRKPFILRYGLKCSNIESQPSFTAWSWAFLSRIVQPTIASPHSFWQILTGSSFLCLKL